MQAFEKNPQLGGIFARWGRAVKIRSERRRFKALGLRPPRPDRPYNRSPEQIEQSKALDARRFPEAREMPNYLAGFTGWEREFNEQSERLRRAATADTTKAVQLSLPLAA